MAGRVRAVAEVGGSEVLRGGWRRRGGSASGKRGEGEKEIKKGGGGWMENGGEQS